MAAADGLGRDAATRTVSFAGISGRAAGNGTMAAEKEPFVIENRFYLGDRDITELLTKNVIKRITSIQQGKSLAMGAHAYV